MRKSTDTSATLSAGHLRRILGLGFGLAVIVGSTIGVGILRAPGLVAGQLPSATAILLVWMVGGLYTLLGSVCLAELGTMIPTAGGYFVYVRRAFGDAAGFAVGWTDWLTYCAVLGYVSIGMAEFLAVLAPGLAPYSRVVAATLLVGLVALQWAGLRVSSRFQEVTTALKFAAFVALTIAAFLLPASTSVPAASATMPAASLTFSGLIVALQAVVITYGGWQSAPANPADSRIPETSSKEKHPRLT